MKKLKVILSFVFTLGIMCLGFSFASKNFGLYNAFAYSSQIVLENSTFDMAGGTISNAIGDNGGAVYVGNGATFTMTGGKIKNCTATNGGAVYVANGGVFNFDGGTIENCSADLGYAIYVQAGGTLNYENNENGFSGCGEDQNLHIYAEEGATVIGAGTPINIYVDGVLSNTIKKSGDTYTINEAEMPLQYENCCGYFYDEKLSQCTNGVVDLTRVESASTFAKRTANEETPAINIYTRTANPSNFTFIQNTTTGTYDIKAKSTSIGGDIVLPKERNNVQTSIYEGTNSSSGAFYNCASMTGITFQDGLTTISNYAFHDLSSLTCELIIPDSVTTIGDSAFFSCGFTGSLIIPDGVTTIGDEAFSFDAFTGSLIIPDSVITIGDCAFADCGGFSGQIIIGNGVESIGEYAFYDNSYKLELILGNNIKTIGDCAFQDNYYITGNLNLPEGLTSLGYYAFAGCPGLTGDLTIPSTLVNMAEGVFYDCSGLDGVLTIKNGVTRISNFAFYYCSGLTGDLIIPDSVTSIGGYAFSGCGGLTGDLIVPNRVTSIGNRAFAGCSGLTSVYIPSTVTTISASSYSNAPFYKCSSSLVIYTDVANASSKPSGWSTYWNYYDSSNQLQVVYGCSLDSDGNIVTPPAINFYVDGTYHSSFIPGGTSYTLVESDMPLEYENCCGYFLNEELTKTIKNDIVDLSNGDVNLYTRTADPSLFGFNDNGDGTCEITSSGDGYSVEELNLIMPREYNGKKVTAVAETAFENELISCELTNIVLSSEITELLTYCFSSDDNYHCINSVNLHNNIVTIESGAFYASEGIYQLIIPESVTSIGDAAFYSCYDIEGDLIIPNSVTSIWGSAFSGCSGLTSITIGNSVTNIGEYAFYYCSGLTRDLIIPDSVISIGSSAFYQCSGLTSVIIGNSVASIGDYAFSNCSGLTSVTIGNSVTSIGNYAFVSCSGLTNVTIGNSVTSIGDSAFTDCEGLTNVIIGNSVTSIGSSAFSYCDGLTSVYIPSSVTTIPASSYARSLFYNCSSSLVIYTDVANASSKPSGWGTYWNYYDSSNQLRVVYGCSLDSDGNIIEPAKINIYVDGASTPTKVLTPRGTSYTVVESDMPLDYESCCGYFYDEILMTTIKNNTIDLTKGDVNLYTRTATDSSYFTFEMNEITGNYDIVDTSLTKVDVVLPKEYQGIQVGLGITDERYDPETNRPVFTRGVSSIILPSGITEIIDYAFYCCLLTEVGLIIPDSVISIGNSAFAGCGGLTSLIIPDSVISIGNSAFAGCGGLTSLIIPDSVISIGECAFYSCSGLTSVTMGNGVTSIGEYAFHSCRGLTSVTIPNSVTSIGNYAFHSCDGLTSVTIGNGATIGNGVTSIGEYAFYYCSGLTSVTIGNNVTSIGDYAFHFCDGLTSVTIPSSVTSIGEHAFYSCSGLTSVYIPSSVTTISASSWSSSPFYQCSSSLVIYTDVANASSKPSGWGKYWNYKSSSATYTTNYGYTLEQYKSAVGLTFAPDRELVNEVDVEEKTSSYKIDTSYLQTMMLEKREYIAILKENEKTA